MIKKFLLSLVLASIHFSAFFATVTAKDLYTKLNLKGSKAKFRQENKENISVFTIKKLNKQGYSYWNYKQKIKPLSYYLLSGENKSNAETESAKIVIYELDRKKKVTSHQLIKIIPSNNWKKFQKLIVSDNNTYFLDIQLRAFKQEATVKFRNISLKYIGIAPARVKAKQKNLIPIKAIKENELLSKAIFKTNAKNWRIITKNKTKIINDKKSLNGFCAQISGDDPPYFQINFDLKPDKIAPGLNYELYGRFKVKLRRNESGGKVLQCGVFDRFSKKYIQKALPLKCGNFQKDCWKTYQISNFIMEAGEIVFLGPNSNARTFVDKIYVDEFFILPGNAQCKAFYDSYNPSKNIRVYASAKDKGIVELDVKAKKLKLGIYLTKDLRKKSKSFAGISIDYHTEEKSTNKFVLINTGISGKAIKKDINIPWNENAKISEVINHNTNNALGEFRILDIDLEKYAPENWTGKIKLSFICYRTPVTMSGIVISPSLESGAILNYKIIKNKESQVGIDQYSNRKLKKSVLKNKINQLF